MEWQRWKRMDLNYPEQDQRRERVEQSTHPQRETPED